MICFEFNLGEEGWAWPTLLSDIVPRLVVSRSSQIAFPWMGYGHRGQRRGQFVFAMSTMRIDYSAHAHVNCARAPCAW